MSRARFAALVSVAGALASTSASAAPRDLTLADALKDVGVAPAHQVAVAQEAEARAGIDASGAWPATTLTAATATQTARLDLVAGIPLPVFGTLGANRAVAQADFLTSVAELRASDVQLARDVATAWVALARSEARAELSRRSATREDELVTATHERFAAGDASHADELLVVAAAKRAASQAAADAAAIDVASAQLAGLLGAEATGRLHASGGLPVLDGRRAPAAAVHPEVVVAARREDAEDRRVTESSRARWPRLGLTLESAIGDPTLPATDYRIGVAVELPLLGRGGAIVHAAEARLATAQRTRAATSIRLASELAAAHARFAAAAAHAASLDGDVVPAEREAADLARAAFHEGQTGLVVTLEAERALAEAEGEAIDARAEAATAWIELEWASGVTP